MPIHILRAIWRKVYARYYRAARYSGAAPALARTVALNMAGGRP